MLIPEPRRSHARQPTNPFQVPTPPSTLLDIAAPAVALMLLIVAWGAACSALIPSDPAPAHRLHVVSTR